MLRFFVIMTSLLLVPLVKGFVDNGDYPTFAKCDQKIMSSMKMVWNTLGTPKNNLKKIEESGKLQILHTSYNHNNEDNKCFYITVDGNIMNVVFVPKNGESSANHTWVVEEGDDGVIRGHRMANETPDITWNWYTIYFDNGIHVCYICSDNEGSQEPYLGNVMLTEGTTPNFLTNSAISNYFGLLKEWGINFRYNYGSECFSSGYKSPVPSLPSGGLPFGA